MARTVCARACTVTLLAAPLYCVGVPTPQLPPFWRMALHWGRPPAQGSGTLRPGTACSLLVDCDETVRGWLLCWREVDRAKALPCYALSLCQRCHCLPDRLSQKGTPLWIISQDVWDIASRKPKALSTWSELEFWTWPTSQDPVLLLTLPAISPLLPCLPAQQHLLMLTLHP